MFISPWLERLREVDVAVFYLINRNLRNAVFDSLMPFITNKWNFAAPLGLLLLYVLVFRPSRDRIVAVSAIAVVLLADASTYLLKDLFHRIRPCHTLQQVQLLSGAVCTGSFSFPSNHASNMFAVAAFFSYFYRHLVLPCFFTAALIGYSRIYLGLHYPVDVMAGVVWGLFVGFPAAFMVQRLIRARQVDEPIRPGEETDQPLSHTNSIQ